MTSLPVPHERVALEPEDEVLSFVQDLIRIPSVNTGQADVGDGERRCARYIQRHLDELNVATTYLESAPGRGNVMCRFPGADPERPGLLLHCHLDVVPADASEWTVPPFAGEIHDGLLYGRGAVDIKNMAGILLAVARRLAISDHPPARDVVCAWFADEENGGVYGSQWMTEQHPELFAGVTESITEGGGYCVTLPNGRRAYLVSTAEKGAMRARLVVHGTAGHGAVIQDDNPVTCLAGAIHRLGTHRFPIVRTPHLEAMLAGLEQALGHDLDRGNLDAELDALGFIGKTLRATLRNTVNPTMLEAGYKRNVVPSTAIGQFDGRVLPGCEEEFVRDVKRLVGPGIEIEWTRGWTIEAPPDAELVASMRSAIEAEDPDASVIPFMLPGGTDNKLMAKIGINGYGFVPMRVPPDFDNWGMFHAVDERVPVESLRFGARVLCRLLTDL
jgi:acetylornithine deacetylase/succinyl-diaminopimelate desuccinylase-like protein